jgi:hypothetical protein
MTTLWAASQLRANVSGLVQESGSEYYENFQLCFLSDGNSSASLNFFLPTEGSGSVVFGENMKFLFDLQARVVKNDTQGINSPSYHYSRLDVRNIVFDLMPSTNEKASTQEFLELEFLFSQYSIYWNSIFPLYQSIEDDETFSGKRKEGGGLTHKPNSVARGLEKSGEVLRTALHAGGKATGSAIRYLGKQYTASTTKNNNRSTSSAIEDVAIVSASEGQTELQPQSELQTQLQAESPAQNQQTQPPSGQESHQQLQGGTTNPIGYVAVGNAPAGDNSNTSAGAGASTSASANASANVSLNSSSHMPNKHQHQNQGSYVDPLAIEKAERRKKHAEDLHAGVRALAGAALYPVRWTGRIASKMAKNDGNGDADPSKQSPHTKALMDTLGGLGNGLSHIGKVLSYQLTNMDKMSSFICYFLCIWKPLFEQCESEDFISLH